MSRDLLNLHVARYASDGDIVAQSPDTIVAVPASLMREHLDDLYGPEFPHQPADRYVSNALLGALAVLSTDEEMHTKFSANPASALGHYLKDVVPVVELTSTLNKRVNHEMVDVKSGQTSVKQDLAFMVGLADTSSYVIAGFLGIEHPRQVSEAAENRLRLEMPSDTVFMTDESDQSKLFFDVMEQLGIGRSEHLRTITKLRKLGDKVIKQALFNTADLIQVINKTK